MKAKYGVYTSKKVNFSINIPEHICIIKLFIHRNLVKISSYYNSADIFLRKFFLFWRYGVTFTTFSCARTLDESVWMHFHGRADEVLVLCEKRDFILILDGWLGSLVAKLERGRIYLLGMDLYYSYIYFFRSNVTFNYLIYSHEYLIYFIPLYKIYIKIIYIQIYIYNINLITSISKLELSSPIAK